MRLIHKIGILYPKAHNLMEKTQKQKTPADTITKKMKKEIQKMLKLAKKGQKLRPSSKFRCKKAAPTGAAALFLLNFLPGAYVPRSRWSAREILV